jgi:hypothetical protein
MYFRFCQEIIPNITSRTLLVIYFCYYWISIGNPLLQEREKGGGISMSTLH